MIEIRKKDRDALLQSLRAGVAPRTGQHYIQVGRAREVEALVGDIERIADGGAAVRFVIGEYGAGKTFFLNLVRAVAQRKNLVAADADLCGDRLLFSRKGAGRSLYSELMRNLSTRTKPDGGALQNVVEKFVSDAVKESRAGGKGTEEIIHGRLSALTESVGGYDFAQVVAAYWKGHDTGNEQLRSDAVRWLRAEFSTKTEARQALGVRTIIDDVSVYDHLKLMAIFARLAGYGGLLICVDELATLHKLFNTQARNSNYEQLLRIVNDCLQGHAAGLGFIMAGTPELLRDERRGLHSNPAMRTRLAENTFAKGGLSDFSGPVLTLANLTGEDFYVLLQRLRDVFSCGDRAAWLLPDEGLEAFMLHCSKRLGNDYFRTPRTTIVSFVNLLYTLEQNENADWRELLGAVEVKRDDPPAAEPIMTEDGNEADGGGLASFRL